MAFLQNEVDHASRAEEMLRCQLARARHEGNRSPKYAQQVEQQHEQAVKRHAQANQRLDQIMRDGGGRS
jgi:predicted  nucleic acid-binding Zn-ribbon protein